MLRRDRFILLAARPSGHARVYAQATRCVSNSSDSVGVQFVRKLEFLRGS
jgi:hypothetical protein